MKIKYLFFLSAFLSVNFSFPLYAATLPTGFSEQVVVSGLGNATAMSMAPDGRIFVCEQAGSLRVIKNGALLTTPFITLTVNSAGERGLLGVALDPGFGTRNQYLYLYYTATTPTIHNRVSRFTANGDVVVAGSELILLDIETLNASNHNGGAMHFGLDGKLYIAVGDNAVPSNAQSIANLKGKMLRINSDGSIPTDNPTSFPGITGTTSGLNRAIWAVGLRNPFTFEIDPVDGRIFINDVGQSAWEEVNRGSAGANYGWPTCEGNCTNANFTNPVYTYTRVDGCAITGGAFYRGTNFPSEYEGSYFFTDYCGDWIRRLQPNDSMAAFATGANAIDMDSGPDGALYYMQRGAIYRMTYTQNQQPVINSQPQNVTATVGQSATFQVSATSALPLTYQWQKSGVNISGATNSSYVLSSVQLSDAGSFQCVVSNSAGSVTSQAATLSVNQSNTAPTAEILTPLVSVRYQGGQTLQFSGRGTDPQEETLPASALTWKIDFLHHPEGSADHHAHPVMAETSGITSGSIAIATEGETETDVWYRITLTVRDSSGLTHTVVRDVFPRVVDLSFTSNIPGLSFTLDGQSSVFPRSISAVVGMSRSLATIPFQSRNGVDYEFVSWSNQGAIGHNISVPSTNNTYTALFRALSEGPGVVGNTDPSTVEATFLPFEKIFKPTEWPLQIQVQNMNSQATLKLYNRKGQELKRLEVVNGTATWNGRNEEGDPMAAGTYYVVLKQGEKIQKKKVVIVK